MALHTVPYHINFRDAKGYIGRMRFFITEDDAAVGFPADMVNLADTAAGVIQALTNAAFQSDSGLSSISVQGLVYGTNAEYRGEWMKAVYTFSTANGDIARFKVPAPKASQFDTDGITVKNDGSVAIVVAFVNLIKNTAAGPAFFSNRDGEGFAHFEGGIVRLGKEPKRINGRIKSAGLVAGEP